MSTEFDGRCPFCGSSDIWDEFIDSRVVGAGPSMKAKEIIETYFCTCEECGGEFEISHHLDFDRIYTWDGTEYPSLYSVPCPACGTRGRGWEHEFWNDKDGYTENWMICDCPRCGVSFKAAERWNEAGYLLKNTFEADRSMNKKQTRSR